MKFTVQRYCAKNDQNGNPRRVFIIRDESGTIVRTVDEGYAGRRQLDSAWSDLGVVRSDAWSSWQDVTDLGDVDVAPGIYRRMVKWKVGADE